MIYRIDWNRWPSLFRSYVERLGAERQITLDDSFALSELADAARLSRDELQAAVDGRRVLSEIEAVDLAAALGVPARELVSFRPALREL